LSDTIDLLTTQPIFEIWLFILGALLGSFGNVVIYRLPLGQSIAWPGSHCQTCKHPVAWYNNVPIFAWFWLRGKCANCKAPFSFRYPLVEFIMASLFAIAGLRLGPSYFLIEALIFIWMVVCASFIDLDHMILPDKFTLTGIVLGLIGAAINPEREFLPALYGVLAGGGFLWAVAYLYYAIRGREGMGGGDIKLLAWIGAVMTWQAVPITILVSSVIGSIVGIILAIRTKDGMTLAIPFGPYLAGAALLYLLAGGHGWAEWYLSMHGLQ
jgi:leader peptidase (prepilin peptidase)/N-methyltransferase